MKTRPIVPSTLLATLLCAATSDATIVPFAEYLLGEAGSLGANNKPQDSTGNSRHYSDDINGGSATTGNASFHPNATGSTAYLDTSGSGNEGWYSGNMFSSLPTDNFAFGVFARAAGMGEQNGDVFTLSGSSGAFKLSLEGNGWGASSHNVAWIGGDGGAAGSFQADTWVHLALVRSEGLTTFYIDGVAQGLPHGGLPVHGAPHMSVNPGGSSYFDGHIDEARVVTFSPGEPVADIITALQQGVVPTSLVNVGQGATFRTANLSTDEASSFRLGGAVQDSAVVTDADGLSVVAGTAPKHLIHITQEGEIPTGTYPLIYYTGTIGGLGYSGLELAPLPGRITGNLVNNTVDSTIDLVVTGSEAGDLTWTGSGPGGGTWDVEGNTNWVFTGSSVPTAFFAGDTVRFDDNAATSAITVAETVTPSTMVIDNSTADFNFSGSGIGGSCSLQKSGTGTLTLTGPNSHSGTNFIDAGIVRIGDGGNSGSLGTGPVSNFATLVIDRSGTLLMPNPIDGSGTIEKLGSGNVTLSGSSSYTGETILTTGTITSANANCLGSSAGGTTVAAGATLDVFTGGFGAEPIIINGAGVDDLGAIVCGTVAGNLNGVQHLTLASDSTIGGTGRWDVRGSDAILAGNFKLTKIGSNQISLVDVDVTVRDIEVHGGMLTIEYGAVVDDSNPGTITMIGGILGFGGFGNPITCSKPIVLDGGSINTTATNFDGDATVASAIGLAAASNTISAQGGSTLTLSGPISGNGSLAKADNGTVLLAAAPAYSGDTMVSTGTLSLAASGLADNSTVEIGATATLNLGFTGTDTVNALFIAGVQHAAGVYDSTHASGRFTGTGSLTVSTGPVGTNYQLWEIANGIPGAGPTTDSDDDGIANGIEFVIGGDPSGPGSSSTTLLPTATKDATHFEFRFRRSDESASSAPYVQYGSNLAGWTTAQDGAAGVTIGEDDDFHGEGIDRVRVRIPLPVGETTLFARLRVDLP
jgi:autotransporter-associated beta strand protein